MKTFVSLPPAVGSDPDSDIIPRLQAGDERALAVLMDRHLPTIQGLATRMLGDVFAAEDVAQTVFLKTWTKIGEWEPGQAKLITWMRRVTVNLCTDALRKTKPIYTDTVPDVADDSPAPLEGLSQEEQKHSMEAALKQLPHRQRTALTLAYYQEVSQKDGAAIMEISVSAYESLLVRARKNLRSVLDGARMREGAENDL